ncbi:hypothetical protein INR49_031038 [Caranx melampygus]|nr:hypothetical protein INR49_031038 [Caranx melampygus]
MYLLCLLEGGQSAGGEGGGGGGGIVVRTDGDAKLRLDEGVVDQAGQRCLQGEPSPAESVYGSIKPQERAPVCLLENSL